MNKTVNPKTLFLENTSVTLTITNLDKIISSCQIKTTIKLI